MHKIILILFAAVICQNLSAESLRVDIDTAVQMALDYNINLRIEEIDTAMDKKILNNSWNVFLPEITITSTLGRLNEAPASFDMETGSIVDGEHWFINFGFTARLNLSFALFNGIKYNFQNYDAGLIDLETVERQLIRDVKKSFYNLLVFKENVILMRQNLETAEKRFNLAKLNYESGVVSEFDMLSAQVGYENLKPALKEIENGYEIAVLAFKQLLGIESDQEIIFDGVIEPESLELDAQELITKYISNRLDIRGLVAAIDSLENQRKGLILLNYTPAVSLMFSMDPTFTKNPFRDSWFRDADNDWMQSQGMFGITLSMNLDGLIPGSSTQLEIKKLKEEIAKMKLNLEQVIQGSELEIESIIMNLEKSMESLESLKLNVELAERAYELAEEGYRAGIRELIEVENAEDNLNMARLEVLKEKFNYISNILDLEYALNTSIEKIKELSYEE
jgi:outer membrane protein TolC